MSLDNNKKTNFTAHDVASDSDLYFCAISFGKSKIVWECMGYCRTGITVRFARIVETDIGLMQINKYVKPETLVKLVV